MSTFLTLLLSLVTLHVIIDFYFQPTTWAQDKNDRHARSSKLLYHAIIQAVVSCIPILMVTMNWASITCMLIIVGASHWLIDLLKTYVAINLRYFILGQVLHVIVLIGIALHASQLQLSFSELERIIITKNNLIILLGYVVILKPASTLIGFILTKYTPKTNYKNKGLISGGEIIGYLERTLILTFTIIGEYSAIGFILAAKSIFRFGELNGSKNHQLTEYVLLGSLLSVTITSVVGLLMKNWLQ